MAMRLGENILPHLQNKGKNGDETTLTTTEIESAISTEKTRAESAEEQIQSNLNSEESERKSSDSAITSNLNLEITRAKSAESTISSNLSSEIKRAKSAESAEESRAKLAENGLQTSINSEVSRASEAEKTLTDNLDAEITRAKEAEEANAEAISKEISDRKAAITSAIQGLDVSVKGADGSYIETIKEIDGKLSATVQAFDKEVLSTSTDLCAPTTKAVYTSVNTEKSRAEAAEQGLSNLISAEETRAKAAEETLTANLSTEISDRKSAISKEVSDRNTAIANAIGGLDVSKAGVDGSYIETIQEVDGKLKATVQAFDKEITSTSTDLCAPTSKAVYTSVNDEATRAKSAESTLTTNLNSEITRAKSAESTLTTNLNSEITRAKEAEATEKTRAEAAEKTLTDNLAAEVSARKSAISTEVANRNAAIKNAINGLDVSKAGKDGSYIETITEVDGKLTATVQAFDTEITSASTDTCAPTSKAVYTSISAEESRATEAEAAEETRAKAAEKTLTDNLSSEITRAKGAESTLTTNLSAEVTRAKGAESTLTTNLSAETSRAKSAESTLTSNLNSEITNRKAAITKEVTDRNTAIANAVAALDVTDTEVAGKFVSAVSETDGKITVTRTSFSSTVTEGDSNAPSGAAVYNAIQNLGTLYHIKENVADYTALEALDTATLEPGEVRNVADTGDNYVWTGTAWDRLGGSTLINALDYSSPAASGTTTAFIDAVSQTNGKISATKKTITSATTAAKGIVQLSSSVSSTSEVLAATPKAVKTVQDALTTEIANRKTAVSEEATARDTAISTAVSAEATARDTAISTAISTEVTNRNTAISTAIKALDGTVTGTVGAANTLTAFSETDGKVSATFGAIQIASSQVTGLDTALAGKQAKGSYKTVQTAVSSPAASGTSLSFIDAISQNTNGVITATKKTVTTMGAATADKAGTSGLVPAPAAGAQAKYLRADGTWNTPTNTTYSAATQSAAGLMSAADKLKLDNIATQANKYSLPIASSSALGGVKSTTTGTTANRDYNVEVNSDGTMKVNVPWSDTNTTYVAMTGASSSAAGKAGLVPAPAAGKQASFLRGDGTWVVPTNTTYSNMTAATADAAGKAGLVPAPAAGKQTSFLRGDGTWVVPTNTTYSNMTAATSSAAGKAGLVPAPAAGKQTSFLRGDGTWVVPTNTTYSAATTSANGLMTAAMVTKLNGIATGANAYSHPTGDGNLHVPATSTTNNGKYLKAGSTAGSLAWGSLTKADVTTALGYTPPTTNTTYADATTSAHGLMTAAMVTKLNGIAAGANAYSLPTAASSTLGGIKTGYTASGKNYAVVVDTNGNAYVNVPWTDNNTDTKNSAGSTNTASKIFLVGPTSQASYATTYSNVRVYEQAGKLYAVNVNDSTKSSQVLTKSDLSGATTSIFNYDSSSGILTITI